MLKYLAFCPGTTGLYQLAAMLLDTFQLVYYILSLHTKRGGLKNVLIFKAVSLMKKSANKKQGGSLLKGYPTKMALRWGLKQKLAAVDKIFEVLRIIDNSRYTQPHLCAF